MPKSLSQLDPYNSFVQDTSYVTPGKFASAEFVALAFAPPRLSQLGVGGTLAAFPAGIIQNFALSQNKAVARLYELGSTRAYLIPGKSVGAAQFARPYFSGPSLLRIIMAYHGYSQDNPSLVVPIETPVHNVRIPPGYKNLFVNLASDLFSQPHGELVLMKDTDNEIIGMFFLEDCYVVGHNMAVDATGTIWQEAASVQFSRIVPVKLGAAQELQTKGPNEDTNKLFELLASTFPKPSETRVPVVSGV